MRCVRYALSHTLVCGIKYTRGNGRVSSGSRPFRRAHLFSHSLKHGNYHRKLLTREGEKERDLHGSWPFCFYYSPDFLLTMALCDDNDAYNYMYMYLYIYIYIYFTPTLLTSLNRIFGTKKLEHLRESLVHISSKVFVCRFI